MREMLEAVAAELRDLRSEGQRSVYLREQTLNNLREVAAAVARAAPPEAGQEAPAGDGEKPVDKSSETIRRAAEAVAPAQDFSVLEDFIKGGKDAPAPRKKAARKQAEPENSRLPAPPEITLPEGDKETRWNWLRERVLHCPVCNEHVAAGKQVVFGVGSLEADLFFCGEAPGAEEETQGEPFVGPAGQLLDKIIGAMGLQRSDVYIGNILNWRPEHDKPTGNRPPTQEEMRFCLPYLKAQVEIVRPKVMVALGLSAVHGLFGYDPDRKLGAMRGQWHDIDGYPTRVTYHPSYLLRNSAKANKRRAWEDMIAVMERLEMPISEKQRGYFS